MRVCIYGAGAVGGHLAGRFAAAGASVSLVARGAHLAAIRENGLRVETRDGVLQSRPAASDDPRALGTQDAVIVAVKAPALPQVAAGIAPLLGAETPVVFAMNGIPWWYFHAAGGRLDGTCLPRIDPDGAVQAAVGLDRAAGAVVYTACTVAAPGVIVAENPRNRIILGRPDGASRPRLAELAATLRGGGIEVEETARIRDAIWAKLLMNLVGGSLGILTGSAMRDVLCDPAAFEAATAMAREGAAIAHALGCDAGDPDAGVSRLAASAHKQSLLQDLELDRTMEIDALLRVPLDLARMAGTATPALDLIAGLAIRRARAAGLYAGCPPC